MSIVDFEHYFIPDLTQIALFIAVLTFVLLQFGHENILNNFWNGIIFMAFGIFLYLLFYFASNVSAIGIDDIKILFTIGFALGLDLFLPFIFLSGIFGMIFGIIWTKVKEDETFPFAPALALSFLFCLIFDKKLDIVKIMTKYLF
jgi:prepilin signal peptidase PulO-like enzyme (type II secretory pathway)